MKPALQGQVAGRPRACCRCMYARVITSSEAYFKCYPTLARAFDRGFILINCTRVSKSLTAAANSLRHSHPLCMYAEWSLNAAQTSCASARTSVDHSLASPYLTEAIRRRSLCNEGTLINFWSCTRDLSGARDPCTPSSTAMISPLPVTLSARSQPECSALHAANAPEARH